MFFQPECEKSFDANYELLDLSAQQWQGLRAHFRKGYLIPLLDKILLFVQQFKQTQLDQVNDALENMDEAE